LPSNHRKVLIFCMHLLHEGNSVTYVTSQARMSENPAASCVGDYPVHGTNPLRAPF
jgi:hypothetical protein